jgi:DALR anticodon binding protein
MITGVLRLPGAETGRAAPVRPARPGELSIWVASPAQPRPCVLADLVARMADAHHLRASVSQPAGAGWDTLNVHPAQASAGPPEPLDVAVAAAGEPAGSPAHRIQPGAVRPPLPGLTGVDPLALRLALLRHPYRTKLTLGHDDLVAADDLLKRWRELVRHWALSPSAPMCVRYVGDFLAALDDDLNTPSALGVLRELAADAEVPDGSKFEAFAYLDRFCGLDLAREVGR